MANPALQRATFADLEGVAPNLVGELIEGVLYTQPRPAPRHSRASSRLGSRLERGFDQGDGGPGGWWILDEPELHLGQDALVPDLAGWSVETMPELPETAFFPVRPDWACEVLSESTAVMDRSLKMPIYARARVAHLWLVDPILQTLEAYRLEETRWILLGTFHGEARIRTEPFDAVELDLGALWRPPTVRK